MSDVVIAVLLAVIGSTSIWQFISFLINRYDKRKMTNNDIMKEVEKVSGKVDDLSNKVDENQAVLARTHILRFSDELRNNIHHSEEYFRQQLDDCDTYERFCEEHPNFANSYTKMASAYIKTTYETLLKEHKL